MYMFRPLRTSKSKKIKKAASTRRYKDFDQWWLGKIDLNLTVSEYAWLQEKEHHLIKRANAGDTKAQGRELDREFKQLVNFLASKNKIFDDLMDAQAKAYLAAIYLMDLKDMGSPVDIPFAPKKAKNKDTSKVAAYYKK